MTRRVKTVRNFAIVLVILAVVFWRAALYLTSDACVLASVEELGYGTCEIIHRDVYEDGYVMHCVQWMASMCSIKPSALGRSGMRAAVEV